MSAHASVIERDTSEIRATIRTNEVKLTLDAIKSIYYIPNSLVVSEGQPFETPPAINPPTLPGSTWSIVLKAGRHKTSAVASSFIAISGGKGHVYSPDSSGTNTPDELNFYFAVQVNLELGGQSNSMTLYLGQGNHGTTNNWWIGGGSLARKSGGRAVLIVSEPGTADVVEVFDITGGVYDFGFSPWIGQVGMYPSLENWLSGIADSTPISQINLPGTHDSAAFNRVFTTPWATQDCTLTWQLKYGVRLLDIRLSVHDLGSGQYSFITCHGDIGLGMNMNEYQTFVSAMDECRSFLASNQREFIAMRLQVDDWNGIPDDEKPAALSQLAVLVQQYPVLVNEPAMPTLAAARGKIYLINGCNEDPTLGVPLRWSNNTPGQLLPATSARQFSVYVQDQYENLGSTPEQTKLGLFQAAINQAAAGRLLLNFASATQPTSTPIPAGVYINGLVVQWLGDSPAATRPVVSGWSLYDYFAQGFPTDVYGVINIAQLVVDSNSGYSKFQNAFRANLNAERKDELR